MSDKKDKKENITSIVEAAVGRPRSKANPTTVLLLAAKGLTLLDIAAKAGCAPQTLYNRDDLHQAMVDGRLIRTEKILDINFDKALAGDDRAIERELKMAGYLKNDQGNVIINVSPEEKELKEMSTNDLIGQLAD